MALSLVCEKPKSWRLFIVRRLGLNPIERIEPYTSKEGWECRAYENLTATFEIAVKDDVMRLYRVE